MKKMGFLQPKNPYDISGALLKNGYLVFDME